MSATGADIEIAFTESRLGAVHSLQLERDQRCRGFIENREYVALIPESCRDYSLLIDEECLTEEPTILGKVWRWCPGFYAGEVEAELRDKRGTTICRYILDVAPEPGKIGADIFQDMVDEIRAFHNGMLLGAESAQTEIGTSGTLDSHNLAYSRLRSYGELFIQAARYIARDPILRPRYRRERVPVHRVRFMDQQTVRGIMQSPSGAALVGKGPASFEQTLFDVPSHAQSADNAANRAVLYLLRAVAARVSLVQQQLERMKGSGEANRTRTDVARKYPERSRVLAALSEALLKILKTNPWNSVHAPELSTAGLNAISASPPYARVYRLAWFILRRGIDVSVFKTFGPRRP